VVYPSSALSKDYYNDFLSIANLLISALQNKLGISYRMASALFYWRRFFSFFFNYWLIPFILTGTAFKPRIDPIFRPNKYFNKNPGYFDFIIVYSLREKRITEANGEPSHVVRNPLYTCGKVANDYLFAGLTEKNQIIVLPTTGEIEEFVKTAAGSLNDRIMLYASKWADAISILQKAFPGFETYIKYHPMGLDSSLFHRVIAFLTTKNRSLKIIKQEERAEKYILGSSVILGTISSTLWWTNELHGEKVIISLDLWSLPGGDKYSDLDGIHYVRDLTELRNAKLQARRSNAVHKNQLQTLTSFLKQRGTLKYS